MGRKSIPSTTDVARVRHYFGLDQRTLGQYLGVGAAMVGHLEAGRRLLSGPVLLRLGQLAAQVPASTAQPEPKPEAAGAPPAAAPAPGLLAARLDWCQWQLGLLRPRLARLREQARYARRWQQALPALHAAEAAPPLPGRAPLPPGWLARQAAEPTAEAAAEWHLLRARQAGLQAEADALHTLLASPEK